MSMGAQTIGSRGRALLSRHAAAIYGMAGRLWLVLTGPVTIVVLAINSPRRSRATSSPS